MLVLSRRLAETLRIGDEIEITILAVNGNQVRIGIVAPRDVVVDREEIYQKKMLGIEADHDDIYAEHKIFKKTGLRGTSRSRLFGRGYNKERNRL